VSGGTAGRISAEPGGSGRSARRFEVVPYEPAHRPGLYALMRDVWGSYMPEEEFEWWYERNPVRPGTISLAVNGDRVAGMLAMSYARMRLGGREALAAFAIDGATHPDFRGQGIFQALELENERRAAEIGAVVAVGFTNPMAGPILVGRVGWTDVRRLRLWARVLRPLAVLRRRSSAEGGLQSKPATGRVERFKRFGSEAEDVVRGAAATYPDHVVRDAAYLNWRYAESPRGYHCVGAFRDGRLVAFAVLGHKVHGGISAAYVADLVAPSARDAHLLLRCCIADARGGADAVIALPGRTVAAFVAAGFVPTPQAIRLIGKPLADGARLPADGRDWYFSLGDSDIF
jgi:GNAT superfamily N-acetyltransferase